MSRKKVWAAAAVASSVALGIWFFQNASLSRLRAEFIPWMHRLERYRDALEKTRSALRTRDAQPGDPEGIAPLRAWAWKDLDRVALVSFDVEGKPEIERKKEKDKDFLEVWELRGTATFVVDGFRADGARVERSGRVALVIANADAPSAKAAAAPTSPSPSPLPFKENLLPSSSLLPS
jgi:hypothetical protein